MMLLVDTDHGLISSHQITRIVPAPEGWTIYYMAGAEERGALASQESGQEFVEAVQGSTHLGWAVLALLTLLVGVTIIYFVAF
jgi:hypothetical protein